VAHAGCHRGFWGASIMSHRQRRRFFRPFLETLEQRLAPASGYQDFDGLRFVNDQLDTSQTQCNITGGDVLVGYTPGAGESFQGLLDYNLGTTGTLSFNLASNPRIFSVQNATLKAFANGTSVPVWQTTGDTAVDFNVDQLQSASGVALSASGSYSFQDVPGAVFQLDHLALSRFNPITNLADPQVDMQGSVSLAGFDALSIGVNNGNYLIADASGLELTGVYARLQSPDFSKDGLGLKDVSLTASYSNTTGKHEFKLSGGVTFSTTDVGPNGKPTLDGVGGALTLQFDNGSLTDYRISIAGTITISTLSVTIDNLDLQYQTDRYQLKGGITVNVKDNFSFDGYLGDPHNSAVHGLIIQGGKLTEANVNVSTTFTAFGVTVTTNGNPMNFHYVAADQDYVGYGSLDFIVGAGKPDARSLAVTLGDAASPGLVFDNGQLQSLDFALDLERSNSVNVDGLGMTANDVNRNVHITWSDQSGQDVFTLSGQVSINGLADVVVDLGSGNQPGITISNGDFVLDDFQIQVEHVKFGTAFQLRNLDISYTKDTTTGEYDLDVAVFIVFPTGWGIGGNLDLTNGKLNSITIELSASDAAVPIGDTGFCLTYASLSVQNIQDPDEIVFEGSAAIVFGGTNEIAGSSSVNLFAAEDTIKIDRSEFYMSGKVFVGAEQHGVDTNGKPIFSGLLAEGSGTVDLDWGAHVYTAETHDVFLDGVFVVDGGFRFSNTANGLSLLIDANAYVEVPKVIPVIGGDKLAGLSFVFDYDHSFGHTTGFIAAWLTLDVIHKFEVGLYYDIETKHFSLLGGQGVAAVEACVHNSNACPTVPNMFVYSKGFTVPAGATSATLSVKYPAPTGTQCVYVTPPSANPTPIPQGKFDPSNGLELVVPAPGPNETEVHIAGTVSGMYNFSLVSSQPIDPNLLDWSSSFQFTPPTITASTPELPAGSSTATVSLSGTVAPSLANGATVSLFYDTTGQGYHGTPVVGAQNLPLTGSQIQANWDVTGLLPLDYYTYAVINDGVNKPVYSAYSGPVTPQPPIWGSVIDKADNRSGGVGGLTVMLDQINSGVPDPVQLITTTNSEGAYAFWGIPQGQYNVTLLLRSGVTLHTGTVNPQGVTYNTDNSTNDVVFDIDVASSIRGLVYHDHNENGDPSGELGQKGITVYIDVNHNGKYDPGEPHATTLDDGSYQIFNLSPSTTYTVAMDTASSQFTDNFYTTASSAPQQVTLPSDPFGQVDAVDFGLLSLSVVSGSVQGYPIGPSNTIDTDTPVKLSNWTVNLSQNGNVIQTTQTASNGSYTFSVPGNATYTLSQVVQPGWRPVSPATTNFSFNGTSTNVLTIPGFSVGASGTHTIASAVTADFDGDGHNDLAVSTFDYYGNSEVDVFWGNGSGQFSTNNWLQMSLSGPTVINIVVAQLPGGVGPSIIFYTPGGSGVGIFLNQGKRAFSALTNWWNVTDVNGNPVKINDLAVAYLPNNPGGAAADIAVSYANNSNGTGDAGVAVKPYTSSTSRPSSQNWAFTNVTDLAAGDVDGDGNGDLVISGSRNGNSNLTLALADQSGNFTLFSQPGLSTTGPVANVSLGDVQMTNQLDAAYINQNQANNYNGQTLGLSLYQGNGSYAANSVASKDLRLAFLGQPVNPNASSNFNPINSATFLQDVNGDFKPDLICLGYSSFQYPGQSPLNYIWCRVWINQGASSGFFNGNQGTLGLSYVPSPNTELSSGYVPNPYFTLSDYNDDGYTDIAFADPGSGTVKVFFNQSTISNTTLSVIPLLEQPSNGNNFYNGQTGTINGTVTEDTKHTGQRMAGDQGVTGVTVYLDVNHNGKYDAGVDPITTTHDGLYTFTNVADGDYGVGVLTPGQRIATGVGDYQHVRVVNGQPVLDADFTLAVRLLQPVADQTVMEGTTLKLDFPLTPARTAHQLVYHLEAGAPAGVQLDSATGALTWTTGGVQSPGNVAITVRATDPFEPTLSETATFQVTVQPSPTYTFVRNLYLDVLHRAADAPDFAGWVAGLQGGATRAQVAEGFWTSPEHRGMQVDEYYQRYLHRSDSPTERSGWVQAFASGLTETEVFLGFVTSPEYHSLHPSDRQYIAALYQDLLQRNASPDELAPWLVKGWSLDAIAQSVLSSDEALRDWVIAGYTDVLKRAPDPAGGEGWFEALRVGSVNRSTFVEALLASEEYYRG
jgi:hypothetical protein